MKPPFDLFDYSLQLIIPYININYGQLKTDKLYLFTYSKIYYI